MSRLSRGEGPSSKALPNPIQLEFTWGGDTVAGGTQKELLDKAASALSRAEARHTECGRAQIGTPMGTEYANGSTRRAVDEARRNYEKAQDAYTREMSR